MKRLTGRDVYGDIVANEEMQIIASRGATNDDLHKIINHLAKKLCEYEDLEEKGRLTKLPCKVGDDVYYILGIPNETPCIIDSCVFELSDINKIGKTLFLTKSAAEAKLAESLQKEADEERYGDITLD